MTSPTLSPEDAKLPNWSRGEDRPLAKLTEADVREIRARYAGACDACGRRPTMQMLADEFGVTAPLIHNIVHQVGWKHVTDDGEV